MKNPKVAVLMGSASDLEVVAPCVKALEGFGIDVETRVISAHRTPDAAHDFAVNARKNGFEVIIGVAGKAAHLAGVLAAYTTLPVIGLPVGTKMMGGLDSLLSMVQMPKGVPVACVAVDGGDNAGILAAQILGVKYPAIAERLEKFKADQAKKIAEDDAALQEKLGK